MKKKKILISILALGAFFITSNDVNAADSGSKAGIVDTDGANLNVRSKASTSSSVKTRLKDKSYLTIISTTGNWHYVEYKDNTYGYVHKDYIDIISSTTKKVSTGGGNLNVRTGPAPSYSVFDKITNGDFVVTLESYNYWDKVLFEGNKVGYVSKILLSSSYTYPSISLNVPNYKQYDSRWASKVVPNSNKTVKQIGCLITSLSMTESYRTGTTKTPVSIINSSSFASGGSIYWPSNYTTSTSYSGYYSRMYNLLKQGKPVLLGLKKTDGSQHWVVVYGYKGSNTLSASNFLIRDPGSSTRTTLQSLINVYPNFYKLAYYK